LPNWTFVSSTLPRTDNNRLPPKNEGFQESRYKKQAVKRHTARDNQIRSTWESMPAQFDFREYVQTPARTYLCPGWLTSSRWFDLDELSDITVKFDDREVKRHKILLARRCDWFRRAFHKRFAESAQQVVTLRGDEPEAVEAVLRYVYRYGYSEVVDKHVARSDKRSMLWFHLHVL